MNFYTDIVILILNLNKFELIGPQLRTLSKLSGVSVVVGDTGSTDAETLKVYQEAEVLGVRVRRGLKYHFSKNNNDLAINEKGEFLLFLNNDVVFSESDPRTLKAIELMAREMELHPGCGIVGAYLYFPDGALQHAGIDFIPRSQEMAGLPYHLFGGEKVPESALSKSRDIPAVTGACLMIRRDLFERVGGFDEAYSKECQDVDLCLKVKRLGYSIRLVHCGNLVHLENATRPKGDESVADRDLFLGRWLAYLKASGLVA